MPGKNRSDRPRRDRTWYASRRRQQSHEEAQAHAEKQQVVDVPEHPLICADAPQMIADPDALAELIGHVRSAGSFAYDTEFIGELSYFPQLCLVQIATPQRIALVDPFAGLDLSGIWDLLADPAVEKIVHAGEQDLEPVVRHLNKPPANVFDTQVAAGFVSMGYPTGLGRLVESLLGVALGKGLTYTAWDHRPLSPVHQRYAADDVRYLPALKQEIEKRAAALGHGEWLAAECATLGDRRHYESNPQAAMWKIRGVTSLSNRKQRIMAALLTVRDQAAQQFDAPPRTVLGDDMLMTLARKPVGALKELSEIRGMPRKLVESHGEALVLAMAENPPGAGDSHGPLVTAKPEESTLERLAIDSFWSAISTYCMGRGIDPQLVTNRQQIAASYVAWQEGKAPADSPLRMGWREQFIGRLLPSFLDGKVQLRLQWSDHALRADTLETQA